MKPLDSRALLAKLGYSFEVLETPPSRPEISSLRFEDVNEAFAKTRLGGKRLYKHQVEAFEALLKGLNVILVAGTGSGKTEAWYLYVVKRVHDGIQTRVLALYPTLALAHDQLTRLQEYSDATGVRVLAIDAQERERLEKQHGRLGLRRLIQEAHIVVSNPAFLIHELKRLAEGREPLLAPFIYNPSLIVIDELDFYGPRSIALLLAMLRIISWLSSIKPQVAVLTATLANPEDVARFLREITGRDTRVIHGKPFHPLKRTIIVIAKDLEKLRREVKKIVEEKALPLPPKLKAVLDDVALFKENLYKILGYLRANGVEAPSPSIDVTEILKEYVEDVGVTLVFTRSIAAAERIARMLREKLGEKAELVATHHHLVPKERRRVIEEAAREGKIRIIISPRTLAQGVDIGTVIRVVHVGLPEDLREYLQREGRMGRREDIEFVESIVLPYSPWDREILSKGISALKEWLSMPLEKVIINPENKYISLFTGLWKLVRNLTGKLDDEERSVLTEVGVLTNNGVSRSRLKWIWERLNFYEFGPPYGVKRYLIHRDGREVALEPIGYCDLVEHFQVGCIDLANEAIVTGFKRGGRGVVTAVIEEPIAEVDLYKYPAIADAVEEYTRLKRMWGEEPNVKRDILRGMVVSEAVAVVHPPRRGFGRLIKIPNRVVWLVYGEKPVVVEAGGDVIVSPRRATVYVAGETGGVYTDFTYGYVIDIPPWEDPSVVRIGLAMLMIILRRLYGVEFETIKYSVERVSDYKAIEIHEPEAAGVIELIDWSEVAERVRSYKPSSLDYALMALIDEVAYAEFLGKRLDWSIAVEAAARVASYIASTLAPRIKLETLGVKVPKPDRSHRILALGVAWLESEHRVVIGVAAYDGAEFTTACYDTLPLPRVRPPQEARVVELYVQELIDYEGFKLVVSSQEAIDMLDRVGLKLLARLAREAPSAGELWKSAGLPEELFPVAFEEFIKKLGLQVKPATLVAVEAAESKSLKKLREAVEEASKALALQAYLAALVSASRQASSVRS